MHTYLLVHTRGYLKIKFLKVEILHQRGWIIKLIIKKTDLKNKILIYNSIYNLFKS